MRVNTTYPSIKRGSGSRRKMLAVLRWPFIGAAIACVTVNICVGPPIWSPIALVGLYMAWTLIFSIDLVEYNVISQFIKTMLWTSILLTLIDILLIHGWARFVVPLVCLGGLVVCAILFLANLETQKHNMLPLILYIIITLVGSCVGYGIWHESGDWPFVALGATSLFCLVALILILRQDFLREMKRRFHIK